MMKKILLSYSLYIAITWTIMIFILCATPGQYIPTTSWLELLSFDKFVHASIFFGLVFLWLIVFNKRYNNTVLSISLVILSCILYGAILEIMQAKWFSNRSGDYFDFIANTFGCLCGSYIFNRFKMKF